MSDREGKPALGAWWKLAEAAAIWIAWIESVAALTEPRVHNQRAAGWVSFAAMVSLFVWFYTRWVRDSSWFAPRAAVHMTPDPKGSPEAGVWRKIAEGIVIMAAWIASASILDSAHYEQTAGAVTFAGMVLFSIWVYRRLVCDSPRLPPRGETQVGPDPAGKPTVGILRKIAEGTVIVVAWAASASILDSMHNGRAAGCVGVAGMLLFFAWFYKRCVRDSWMWGQVVGTRAPKCAATGESSEPCWFCHAPLSHPAASVKMTLRRDIHTSYGLVSKTVRYQMTDVEVPRCHTCKAFHARDDKYRWSGCGLGLLVGALILGPLVFLTFLIHGESWGLPICLCWTVAAPVIGTYLGLWQSRSPYPPALRPTPEGAKYEFPAVEHLRAQGWR